LIKDINSLWLKINVPEKFKGDPITKFFDIEILPFSHYEYSYDNFIKEVNDLKKRFDSSNEETVFKKEYNKNIPADGLSAFTENIWNTIKSDKNLDIPSQREMLSQYRCNEISLYLVRRGAGV
jgi:hypothetical protein